MNKNNNNKWFSLPLALGLVILISLLAFSILEYIIPFSRDIKWIENSSKAYYQANIWIEEWLYNIYERNNSWSINQKTEYFDNIFSWSINSKYSTFSSWSVLPPAWEWNSEYDKDWNIISSGDPIQLSIWGWDFNTSDNLDITFRMPSIYNSDTLSWSTFFPYIWIVNWQLSWNSDSLNSSWSIINANQINLQTTINFNNLQWINLNWDQWVDEIFSTFYNNNCISNLCSLKLSLINKIETTDWVSIPYLEWKLTSWFSIIPTRYSKIESSGKSYWYKKDLKIRIPSNTINEAFDFTIFQ